MLMSYFNVFHFYANSMLHAAHATLSSANFFKKILSGTLSVLNSLDSDQDRHSVGPDLGPNCLPRLSEEGK